jgi:hypothetical protein
MKFLMVVFTCWIVFISWNNDIYAGCAGVKLGEDGILCIDDRNYIYEKSSKILSCSNNDKKVSGFCSGVCEGNQSCDMSSFSCSYCGDCENEKWCGVLGGMGNNIPSSDEQANVWVRVLERGAEEGQPIAWKGSILNDPVQGNNWSVDINEGGGMDEEGFLTYRIISDQGEMKKWDKNRNKIDAGMKVDLSQSIVSNLSDKSGEYWSNHFCTGGMAQKTTNGVWPDIYEMDGNKAACELEDGSCKQDTDGCWTSNSDSYQELKAVGEFAATQADTKWMDLRYDEYWSLSYKVLVKPLNKINEIKITPPKGKVCKAVRWFGGSMNEKQIGKGELEMVVDDQGVCSVNNYSYDPTGNLVVFELEDALEAPELDLMSSCSADGTRMDLRVLATGDTDRLNVAVNRGGLADAWIPGNNRDGNEDYLLADMKHDNGQGELVLTVEPNVEYGITILPCKLGENFPCRGKLLSFNAKCDVDTNNAWKWNLRAMCINPDQVISPTNYNGDETNYQLSQIENDIEEVIASQSGKTWQYGFGMSAQADQVYSLAMKNVNGEELKLHRLIDSKGDIESLTGNKFTWDETLSSGTYELEFSAPDNWCVEQKTWNVIPVINCGEGELPYAPAEISYQFVGEESNLASVAHPYSNCSKYQIIKSRGWEVDIYANLVVDKVNIRLKPSGLYSCIELNKCLDNLILDNNLLINGTVLQKDLGANNLTNGYKVVFEVPEDLHDRVCGPKLAVGKNSKCEFVGPNSRILDSDK